MSESLEQYLENYSREIFKQRKKIVYDFCVAYAAELSDLKNEHITLDDICLAEYTTYHKDGTPITRWWFEYKPEVED